jgi:hypothetical protein
VVQVAPVSFLCRGGTEVIGMMVRADDCRSVRRHHRASTAERAMLSAVFIPVSINAHSSPLRSR